VGDLAVARGAQVLDLASGTGDLCIDLARVGVRPISMDLSFGMLSADRSGVPRVQTDILRLPVPDGSVDGVTCGFALRNLADLPTFFDELGRVVRPGGRIALLDVSVPRNPLVRWGNNIYFGHVVPRIGALLSDGAAYRYLPKSVAYLPTPEVMVAFSVSNGTAFLLQVMPARSKACSVGRPLAPLGRKSTSIRWVSVPPVTISRPLDLSTSASALAFSTTFLA
jgi:demethylmenaquinone methyltransferase/2-methoxy-6-polyprenyl-1,4-benzoquinol methylase